MAPTEGPLASRNLPEMFRFGIGGFAGTGAAVKILGQGNEPLPEVPGLGERFLVMLNLHESSEVQVEVEMRPGPRHNMHVAAPFDLADQAGETREKSPQQILELGFRIPDIGSGDEKKPTGFQFLKSMIKEEPGVREVLDPFAAANARVGVQAVWQTGIEIGL